MGCGSGCGSGCSPGLQFGFRGLFENYGNIRCVEGVPAAIVRFKSVSADGMCMRAT
jgi:hypothetical protein